MPILQQKPVTPSGRFFLKNKVDLAKKRPERALTKCVHRKKVEMHTVASHRGVVVVATKGFTGKLILGGTNRSNHAKVIALEYDPNRTAHLALLEFEDGTKPIFLHLHLLSVGDILVSSNQKVDFKPGNALPLNLIPSRY